MSNKGKVGDKIINAIATMIGMTMIAVCFAVVCVMVKSEIDYHNKEKQHDAVVAQKYAVNTADMNLCKMKGLPEGDDAVFSVSPYGNGWQKRLYERNFLAVKAESDLVVVEQNLPLPVAGTGYDAVMPKDHVRYKAIKQVFDYVGDLMGKKFIIVDDRNEVLGEMTADAADRIPVLELYLALDEGRYMGYPYVAWADALNGVLGVEVWWWYDDNMWSEGGYHTFLHEIGHLLGLDHVDEEAGHETVMGGTQRDESATRTFGLHDLAGLKYLWCSNPVK